MNKERLFQIGATIALVELGTGAFSWATRQIIKQRAGGVSELSGTNGVPMHCSHIDHRRDIPNYDDPENGLYVTIYEHLEQHLEAAKQPTRNGFLPNGLKPKWNEWAIGKLISTIQEYERTLLQHTACD